MIQGRRPRPSGACARVRDLTRMQATDADGTGASRPGSPPPASCAVTRDQVHHQGSLDPRGMRDGRSADATAIKESPVRGRSG